MLRKYSWCSCCIWWLVVELDFALSASEMKTEWILLLGDYALLHSPDALLGTLYYLVYQSCGSSALHKSIQLLVSDAMLTGTSVVRLLKKIKREKTCLRPLLYETLSDIYSKKQTKKITASSCNKMCKVKVTVLMWSVCDRSTSVLFDCLIWLLAFWGLLLPFKLF